MTDGVTKIQDPPQALFMFVGLNHIPFNLTAFGNDVFHIFDQILIIGISHQLHKQRCTADAAVFDHLGHAVNHIMIFQGFQE